MTRLKTTQHDPDWSYTFPLPLLDVQQAFQAQVKPKLSRLVGVDGRYSGRLKRFPGWKEPDWTTGKTAKMDISGLTIGGSQGASLFKPFVIQKGASGSKLLRGVLFLANDGGSPANDKLYAFFSEDGAAITTSNDPVEVHDFGTGDDRPAYLDMTVDHDLIYLVGEDTATAPNRIEKLIRYAGSSGGGTNGWRVVDWDSKQPKRVDVDPAHTQVPNTSPTGQAVPGYLLPNMTYGFCYRFVYPEQGFVGPLSPIQEIDTGSSSGVPPWVQVCIRLTSASLVPPTGYGNIFSRALLQVFRTTDYRFDDETGRSYGGNMYLEAEFEVPRETGTRTGTYNPNTGYVAGASPYITSADSIDTMGIAVGDIIYLCHPCPIKGLVLGASDQVDDYGWVVYRRTVTTVDTGFETIGLDRELGGPDFIPSYNATAAGTYWISKQGDGVDTSGDFQTLAVDAVRSKPSAYIGLALAPWAAGSDTPEGLQDEALIHMPQLTAKDFSTFDTDGNPRAKFVREYQDFFVYVTSASKEAGGYDVIRWGDVDFPRKGLIPVTNRRTLPNLNDEIKGLLEADPFMVVLMNNKILRLHRSGGNIADDLIHNRFGTLAADAAIVVGTNLYLPSPSGILLVDLTSGQVDALNATQHFFGEGSVAAEGSGYVTGKWRADLANLQGAYDAELGALVFLNPDKHEMLIVWLNHGVLTHHIDVPFDRLISTGDLIAGGLEKALFFNDTSARFYEINADRSALSRTTFSFPLETGLTYNGVTDGATANKLTDSTATFSDRMEGHFVRVRQSSGVWKRAVINDNEGGGVLLLKDKKGDPTQIAATSGLIYAIGGIPMQVTMAPLSGHPEEQVLDLFKVKKVTSMGAAYANTSPRAGETGGSALSSTYDLATYQLFERDHTLATDAAATSHAAVAEKAIDDDENANNFQKIQRNHSILVPGLEIWCSDLDLDLLGVVAEGTIERSKRDTRP
jgi:hypothetical protein